MKIAFDIDGTLMVGNDFRKEVVDLLISFLNIGWMVYIHSGGGLDYATSIRNKIVHVYELDNIPTPVAKGGYYDIAVDDMEYDKCDYLIKV